MERHNSSCSTVFEEINVVPEKVFSGLDFKFRRNHESYLSEKCIRKVNGSILVLFVYGKESVVACGMTTHTLLHAELQRWSDHT